MASGRRGARHIAATKAAESDPRGARIQHANDRLAALDHPGHECRHRGRCQELAHEYAAPGVQPVRRLAAGGLDRREQGICAGRVETVWRIHAATPILALLSQHGGEHCVVRMILNGFTAEGTAFDYP